MLFVARKKQACLCGREEMSLTLKPPLDDDLGQEAQKTHAQAQKQHKGAKASSLGLPRQLADDEQHVEDERAHPVGEEEARYLRFGKAKDHGATPLVLAR